MPAADAHRPLAAAAQLSRPRVAGGSDTAPQADPAIRGKHFERNPAPPFFAASDCVSLPPRQRAAHNIALV